MSLEECRRLAEEKLEKDKELRKEMRHSRGMVDGENVKVWFSANPFAWPRERWVRERWVVRVEAYGMGTQKYFKEKDKDSAEKYFERLTQEYGLEENE